MIFINNKDNYGNTGKNNSGSGGNKLTNKGKGNNISNDKTAEKL